MGPGDRHRRPVPPDSDLGLFLVTKAMAVELAPRGIRVNSVAPTFVETSLTRPMLADPAFRKFVMDMVPLGTVAAVEDVAAAVVFLASPAARMITGQPSCGRRLDCGLIERLRRIRIHFPLALQTAG